MLYDSVYWRRWERVYSEALSCLRATISADILVYRYCCCITKPSLEQQQNFRVSGKCFACFDVACATQQQNHEGHRAVGSEHTLRGHHQTHLAPVYSCFTSKPQGPHSSKAKRVVNREPIAPFLVTLDLRFATGPKTQNIASRRRDIRNAHLPGPSSRACPVLLGR